VKLQSLIRWLIKFALQVSLRGNLWQILRKYLLLPGVKNHLFIVWMENKIDWKCCANESLRDASSKKVTVNGKYLRMYRKYSIEYIVLSTERKPMNKS